MYKCKVIVDNSENQYEGQYEFVNDCLEIEIFDYYDPNDENTPIGSEVKYKQIEIADLKNHFFAFSPLFYYAGSYFGLTQYQTYKTDFYMSTKQVDSIESFSKDIKIESLIVYHPVLNQCFTNPSLQIMKEEKSTLFKIINNPEKKIIDIKKNNIEKIEFGGTCITTRKNNGQEIFINSENNAKIYFENPVVYEDILRYIKEFDVFVNAYRPSGMHVYATYFTTPDKQTFELVHKLLGKEKYCHNTLYQPIRMDFYTYIEKMYKTINYRTTDDRNKYLPFEMKNTLSLEEQYLFYFRCIDLYMGEYLENKAGQRQPSNYERLSCFVDENIDLFQKKGSIDIDNLKKELNSLRNQYVHEGYYLHNNEFAVTEKKKVLYYKTLDYNWLFDMVKIFKFCVYKILYTKVLDFEIDEAELKNALHCWF